MNMSWGGNREKNNEILFRAIEGIELSPTERTTLEWLARQDKEKIEAIYKIIKKTRVAGFERALEIVSKKKEGENI
jgi:hypothetical protein